MKKISYNNLLKLEHVFDKSTRYRDSEEIYTWGSEGVLTENGMFCAILMYMIRKEANVKFEKYYHNSIEASIVCIIGENRVQSRNLLICTCKALVNFSYRQDRGAFVSNMRYGNLVAKVVEVQNSLFC